MKKFIDKITKDPYFLKGTIGLMLCLIAVFGALNRGIVSEFFTWLIAFLFGWFFYVFYLIVFLIGIRLIFARKEFKLHWGITIAGIIVLLVGCLILATNSMTGNNGTTPLTFANFYEKFSASIDTKSFPLISYEGISGGFFGYLFVAILNSGITYNGTIAVGVILVCVGVILALIKTIIRLIKSTKDYKNRKIKKVDSEFSEAKEQKAFSTTEVIESTRTTTVITPDSDIPKENTQSIAIQNPNGGVGVGLTSINRAPAGLREAKYNPKQIYETESETTTLKPEENKVEVQNKAETVAITPAKESEVKESVVSMQPSDIPVAKPASFKNNNKIDEQILKTAQQENQKLDGAEIDANKQAKPTRKKVKFIYPTLDLLTNRDSSQKDKLNIEVCNARMEVINNILSDFNVGGKIVSYTIGPSVTRYDLQMDRGESAKTVEKYVDDIASGLNGIPCRFVQVVPGKTTSGLEIANRKPSLVNFKDCLEHLSRDPGSEFLIPFGKDISGNFVEADLKDFPHMLVCGTTGSGKSVFMHSLVMTLIMRNNVDNLRMIIIDPKRVEFNKYKDLPFLLCNPINDGDEACLVLNELCKLMEERYDYFDEIGVENLKQYNKYCVDHNKEILPRIVVLIDEYADLVDQNKQISSPVVRLAQKARAAGIHLIIATQRPSVNVITGVIKSNIPTRVALMCSSTNDSVVVLSQGGAEKLLGNGDMLVLSPQVSKQGTTRVQGAYVDNSEIKKVVYFLKENYPCEFDPRFVDLKEKSQLNTDQMKEVSYDKAASDEEKYKQIREDVMRRDYCSLSYVQRTYGVGFPRAGKIIVRLMNDGVLSEEDEGNKGKKVLLHNITPEERTGSVEQSTFTPDKKE